MKKTFLVFLVFFGIIFGLVYLSNNLVSRELEQKPSSVIIRHSQPAQPVEDKSKVNVLPMDLTDNSSPQPNSPATDKTITNQQIIYELPLEDTILVQ